MAVSTFDAGPRGARRFQAGLVAGNVGGLLGALVLLPLHLPLLMTVLAWIFLDLLCAVVVGAVVLTVLELPVKKGKP